MFEIETINGMLVFKNLPSPESVHTIADEIVNYWPKDFKIIPPNNENKLCLLYWGHRNPSTFINTITRAALYADQILVVNPFVDIMLYHPQDSPLKKPEDWINIYTLNAAFMILLEPWIKSGIISVIENPVCFSVDLLDSTRIIAERRMKKIRKSAFNEFTKEFLEEELIEIAAQVIPEHRQSLLEVIFGKATQEDIAKLNSSINDILHTDVIRTNIPLSSSTKILKMGSGMNYEQAALNSHLHDAILFSNLETIRKQIMFDTNEKITPISKIADTISSLQFQFLNNVKPEFVIQMRQEGKLSQFRAFLLNFILSHANDSVDSLSRQLTELYKIYKNDWQSIQRKLARQAFVDAPIVGFLSGNLAFAAIATLQIKSLVTSIWGRRKHERLPLSLMLKLDRNAS